MDEPNESPVAVIFLPALGEDELPQPVMGIAHRIARAIDLAHVDEKRRFYAKSLADLDYGSAEVRHASGASVIQETSSGTRTICDVYKVDYRDKLFGDIPTGMRAIVLLSISLFSFGFRWLRACWYPSRGLRWRKRLQLLAGGIIVGVLVTVLLMFVVGALSAVPVLAGRALDIPSDWYSKFNTFYALLVTAGGTGLIMMPDIRKTLENLGNRMVALQEYLGHERRREETVAEVTNALEAIAESGRYRQVLILGYSFGAIVGLDATILKSGSSARITKFVKTVVTIGCPTSFIETFWPGFFNKTEAAAASLPSLRWVNVYNPIDILSSQFIGDKNSAEPSLANHQPNEEKVYPEGPNAEGWLVSLKSVVLSHGLYWSLRSPDLPAVFGLISSELWNDRN